VLLIGVYQAVVFTARPSTIIPSTFNTTYEKYWLILIPMAALTTISWLNALASKKLKILEEV